MKYQVTFFVKINDKTEAIVVKVNASTEYLAVARATLKYKRMFPAGNEPFEAIEVVPLWALEQDPDKRIKLYKEEIGQATIDAEYDEIEWANRQSVL